MPRRLALVPVFLFLCLNLSAQQRTGPGPSRGGLSQKYSIRGQLRSNETSQPLEMVKVQLVASGGETMAIQFTRSNGDRKSTRLNSSHLVISYAVFCLKKKKKTRDKNVQVR